MTGLSILGGGLETPTIGSSGGPQQYIADVLSLSDEEKEGESKDEYSHHGKSEHEGGGSFLERHTLLRWAIYGFAAFGAWKLGMGDLIKRAPEHFKGGFERIRTSFNAGSGRS